MAGDSKSRTNGDNPRKPRASASGSGANTTVKKHDEPRPAPSFVSTLKNEEIDFPRGGGTSLTALEVKQTRAEGRREAEAEAAQDVSGGVA
jgi:rRNA biogenesis protein RRP5